MSRWPSTKASRVLAALKRIGWRKKRQEGSHLRIERLGWADHTWAFHDGDELGPPILAKIAKRTGLTPGERRVDRTWLCLKRASAQFDRDLEVTLPINSVSARNGGLHVIEDRRLITPTLHDCRSSKFTLLDASGSRFLPRDHRGVLRLRLSELALDVGVDLEDAIRIRWNEIQRELGRRNLSRHGEGNEGDDREDEKSFHHGPPMDGRRARETGRPCHTSGLNLPHNGLLWRLRQADAGSWDSALEAARGK